MRVSKLLDLWGFWVQVHDIDIDIGEVARLFCLCSPDQLDIGTPLVGRANLPLSFFAIHALARLIHKAGVKYRLKKKG